ncbi:MAG TPA: hypothetical protein VM431_01465 [Phycisphaerae bacterium]|nr:hypothetical protein [Phycisphaerae bacterium]
MGVNRFQEDRPIVCSPHDAIRTLLKSGLDFVTLNDYLVWKKGGGAA